MSGSLIQIVPASDVVEELLDLPGVVRDEHGAQAVLTVVGQLNGFVEAGVFHDRHGGTEGLIAHNDHGMIYTRKHGRFVEEAFR